MGIRLGYQMLGGSLVDSGRKDQVNPLLWLVFPFACVALVPAIVGVARFVRWLKFRHEWLNVVRTQRTSWEREEIELLRGQNEHEAGDAW